MTGDGGPPSGTRPANRDEEVSAAVSEVQDPEIDITLADLGVLRDVAVHGDTVRLSLVPTRVACPARSEMERRLRAAVADVRPTAAVSIDWADGGWRPADVSARGRRVLGDRGYVAAEQAERCPYCDSTDVTQTGAFGGSVCKIPFGCRSCGSCFDLLRSSCAAVDKRPE
jgi:ring-1,2-phenylacetyl-CoA epoxidase subunit PaaD